MEEANGLRSRLKRLDSTQDAIEALSDTVFTSLKSGLKAEAFCRQWLKTFQERSVDGDAKQLMNYIYSANDLLQKSKRLCSDGGAELRAAFRKVLPEAFSLVSTIAYGSEDKVLRVLELWKERKVFENPFLTLLQSKVNLQVDSEDGEASSIEEDDSQEGGEEAEAKLKRQETMRSEATEPSLSQIISMRKTVNYARVNLVQEFQTLRTEIEKLGPENVSKMSDGQIDNWVEKLKQLVTLAQLIDRLIGLSSVLTQGVVNSVTNKMSELEEKISAANSTIGEYASLRELLEGEKKKFGPQISTIVRKVKKIAKRKQTSTLAEEKRRKEREAEEKRRKLEESETPMTYNKMIKAYVPMVRPGETESWRDN